MVLRQTATAMPEAEKSFQPFEGGTPRAGAKTLAA